MAAAEFIGTVEASTGVATVTITITVIMVTGAIMVTTATGVTTVTTAIGVTTAAITVTTAAIIITKPFVKMKPCRVSGAALKTDKIGAGVALTLGSNRRLVPPTI